MEADKKSISKELADNTTVSEMFEQLEAMKQEMLSEGNFQKANELETARILVKHVLIHNRIKQLEG